MPFRHSRIIALLFLLALATLPLMLSAGCAPMTPPEPAWEKDAQALLDQADGLFWKKQYSQAAKILESFFDRFPTSKQRDMAFYLMGEIRFSQHDYPRALSYYKEVIEQYPGSPLIKDARYRLGQCYFEIKEYDPAIANLADRSKVTDPARLKRISEMLSAAYLAKKNHPSAIKELLLLFETAQNEKQKNGYRSRIRELVEKNLTADELKFFANGTTFPADIARLRLATLLLEQRQFSESAQMSKGFLETFPNHQEKARGELLKGEATIGLTAPKYTVAALLPQTGQLAFFGDRVLKGIQLAAHTYNTQDPENRVEIIVKDTEGSPDKAVAALNELAAKGIIAAIGPLLTKEAEAIAPLLEKLKVPVITPAASGEGIGRLSPWLFRNALTNSSQAAEAARRMLELKAKKIVIFHPDDAYGKDLSRLFVRDLERKADVIANISYPAEVKDFGPYIKRAMEADLRSRKISIPEDEAEKKKLLQDYTPGFDALYLPGHAERVGLLIPQLAFYNVKDIIMIGSNDWHSADLIERGGRHADGAMFIDGFFPESTDPAIKQVIDAYRSTYQEEPDILAAQAYDATMMVFSLIRANKNTPQAVRDGLAAMKDYPGISGSVSFVGSGDAQKKLFLIKVQDGRFVPYTGEQ